MTVKNQVNTDGLISKLATYEMMQMISKHADFLTKTEQEGDFKEPTQNFSDVRNHYLDYHRLFCEMMLILAKSTEDKTSITYCKKENTSEIDINKIEILIKELLGEALKSLTYNSDLASSLAKVIREHGDNFKNPESWLPKSYKKIIKESLKGKRNGSLVPIQSWTRFLGVSENSVYSRLASGPFSYHDLRRIVYCLMMRAFLTFSLRSEVFLQFSFGDYIEGVSHLPRYFDGYLTLESEDKGFERSYIIKTSCIGISGVSMINDFCTSLEDIAPIMDETPGGILFIPGYPTTDTLRAEVYWNHVKHMDITVLYLTDLYEFFRLWNQYSAYSDTDSRFIEKFLLRRVNE